MKRFISRIVAFGCCVLLIVIGIELFLLTRPNQYSYKANYMRGHGDRISILLLGSSHTLFGLNPAYFEPDSCFNAATSGRPLYYDYKLLKDYIQYMPNLKIVVMAINPYNIIDNLHYDIMDQFGYAFYSTYRCMHLKYMGLRYGMNDFYYYSEIMNSMLDWRSRLFNQDYDLSQTRENGFEPLQYSKRDSNWSEKQLFLDVMTKNKVKAMDENLDYMENIVSLCAKRNIKVFFVTAPFYKTQKVRKEYIRDLDIFMKKTLASSHNVYWRNFMLEEDKFSSKDYFNATHLNDIGAAKWSVLVRDWIKGKLYKK